MSLHGLICSTLMSSVQKPDKASEPTTGSVASTTRIRLYRSSSLAARVHQGTPLERRDLTSHSVSASRRGTDGLATEAPGRRAARAFANAFLRRDNPLGPVTASLQFSFCPLLIARHGWCRALSYAANRVGGLP